MHLVLMTTTDMQSDRGADFARMTASVASELPAGIRPTHIVLLQRCSEAQRKATEASLPYAATVLSDPARMSLSAARNRMLASARDAGVLTEDALVAFPDDDCWYPQGLVRQLLDAFSGDRRLGLLVSRVSLEPVHGWRGTGARPASPTDVLRRSTSNSIFLRGDIVARVGDFDVSLGLGTPGISGEDTDYALRAWRIAPRTLYVDLPLVGHKEPDLESISKYFGGSMLVASRYAMSHPVLFGEFVRKFAVGGYLVLRRRLAVSAYLSAIYGSVGAFGRSAT